MTSVGESESVFEALSRSPLVCMRLDSDHWAEIEATRQQGVRFSLHFTHEEARKAKAGSACLVVVQGQVPGLYLGIIRSIAATSTFDSRVLFDFVAQLSPRSLPELVASLPDKRTQNTARGQLTSEGSLRTVSSKVSERIIQALAANPNNHHVLRRIAAFITKPKTYRDARALEQNAIELALKIFGASNGATTLELPEDSFSGLGTVHLLEDAVIENDARWAPGWTLSESDLRGRAVFKKEREELEVFTANKRPLEELFGVDLIYLNRARGSIVMLQYKMMERDASDDDDENGWLVRVDKQFRDELDRMQQFDRDLESDGPYRLNAGSFYFKLVRRNASTNSPGIILSKQHVEQIIGDDSGRGSRGGIRISYKLLDGHYLRGEALVELIRSGYIGTRGATTDHLQTLIDAALNGGRAVVAAIERKMDLVRT